MSDTLKFEDLKFYEDPSVKGFLRTRVVYDRGYQLSVIKEPGKNYYEIGAYKNDKLSELPGITDEGNEVSSFLSPELVSEKLKKMFWASGGGKQEIKNPHED